MKYPIELRKLVLRVKATRGLTYVQTSELFGIGKNTLVLWHRRIEPATKRGYKPRRINSEALIEDVKKHPDSYQYERAQRLGVSQSGICVALKRLGITYKKRHMSTPRPIKKPKDALSQE